RLLRCSNKRVWKGTNISTWPQERSPCTAPSNWSSMECLQYADKAKVRNDMNRLVLGFAAALLCVAFAATEADAARLGGARSLGTQRSITSAPPASVPAKPAQAQQAAAPATAAQPAAASGMSRWMPLLGGLALGGAL